MNVFKQKESVNMFISANIKNVCFNIRVTDIIAMLNKYYFTSLVLYQIFPVYRWILIKERYNFD